jgi:formylglycine-generating enzyme required for sulfatase activity
MRVDFSHALARRGSRVAHVRLPGRNVGCACVEEPPDFHWPFHCTKLASSRSALVCGQDSELRQQLAVTAALAAALVTLLTTGCASMIGLDDMHRTGPSSADGGADGGGASTSPVGASSRCGAQDGGVQVGSNGNTFCIDATEVTNGEYASFLAAGPPPSGSLPNRCSNHAFEPSQGWPAPQDATNEPVTWVDWCDAFAYCAWAGASLCGQLGGGWMDPMNDPASGEWYLACSGQAGNAYPYGASYMSGACNDNTSGPVAVGSSAQCVGGYAGLFDMSGNVAEWEFACGMDSSGNDVCSVRGGSFAAASAAQLLACDARQLVPRTNTAADIGIRCCNP